MLRQFGRKPAITAILAIALLASGCSSFGKKKTPTLTYQERPVELLYSTGAAFLDAGGYPQAVLYFQEVERQHPYSEWARRAILMTAFAHYRNGNYNEAIADTERYTQLFPGNPAAPYAYYLRAVCYFDQIVDVNRDQGTTEQALTNLRDVIQRYPRTDYAADARLKIDMVNDQLAGKEMSVGRYYLREGATLAAINRFKTVIDKYQTTSHTPEALYRLVEGYTTLGVMEEAKRNAAVLGANFPGDVWYADAYKLLTEEGVQPTVKPAKAPHRRGFWPFGRHGEDGSKLPKGAAKAPPTT
ncbi:MAG TPA: outer membrane protein assembly factor BamD [Caulobacteraceae bacterium]|nr:outer membrane protein assembly factor BamD [Caulobacteraceae bacterium]